MAKKKKKKSSKTTKKKTKKKSKKSTSKKKTAKKKAAKKQQKKEELDRNTRKEREGKVVSNKMDKSLVVEIERKIRHPKYGKTMRQTHKYMAHDDENKASTGDWVRIMECRPYSKHKKWRLTEIVEKAK